MESYDRNYTIIYVTFLSVYYTRHQFIYFDLFMINLFNILQKKVVLWSLDNYPIQ